MKNESNQTNLGSIYDKALFDKYKTELEDVWMKSIISEDQLKKDSNNFVSKMNKDFVQNNLLINLFNFQCHYLKPPISEFHIPFPQKFVFKITTFINEFQKGEKIGKFETFISNEDTEQILKSYFWNVTFPNIFGSFVSKEFCEEASNFLGSFSQNEYIYSNGVISFVKNNILFQDAFLNTFYTCINYGENEYKWCKYKFEEYEAIIQESLIQAIRQLNKYQLEALKNLHKTFKQSAEKLIFTDIIKYNIEKVWPNSPLFVANEMLNSEQLLKDIDEKYMKDDDQSIKNREVFILKIFNSISKLSANDEIRFSDFIFNAEITYCMTNLDCVIIWLISGEKDDDDTSGFELNKNELLELKGDRLLMFIDKLSYHFNSFEIFLNDSDKASKNKEETRLGKAWKMHESECLQRNIRSLAFIYEDLENSYDKELAFYGLEKAYLQYKRDTEFKKKMTERMRMLVPLKTAIETQDAFIQASVFRLCKLLKYDGSLNDFLMESYVNYLASIFFHRSITVYNYRLSGHLQYHSKLREMFEKVFFENLDDTKENIKAAIVQMQDKDEKASILLDHFRSYWETIKIKFISSLRELNSTEFVRLADKFSSNTFIITEYNKFDDVFDIPLKINKLLIYGFFLNNPQDHSFQLEYCNDDAIKENKRLDRLFVQLDRFGVFSYIESAIYCLYKSISGNSENKLIFGRIFVAVPVIIKMTRQFFGQSDDEIHPSVTSFLEGKHASKTKYLFNYIFNCALNNKKMSFYADDIEKNQNGEINMLSFFKKFLEYAIENYNVDCISKEMEVLNNKF